MKKLLEEVELLLAWITPARGDPLQVESDENTLPTDWEEQIKRKLAEFPDVLPVGPEGQEWKPKMHLEAYASEEASGT